jgi:predicted transcriptional regulator
MGAKREFRNRDEDEVAVLDALVERPEDGMTVFELRAQADVPIDDLETALGELKSDNLISVEENGGRTVIIPAETVVPDADEPDEGPSVADRIRDRLPF